MAITALPTPPSRDDPANFATRADDFLGALPDFATEANDLATAVNADAAAAATDAGDALTYKNLADAAAALAADWATKATVVSGGEYSAKYHAQAAAASAASAVNAPGTSATSTTSLACSMCFQLSSET